MYRENEHENSPGMTEQHSNRIRRRRCATLALAITIGCMGAAGCRDRVDADRDVPLTEDDSMAPKADTNADVQFYDEHSVPNSGTYIPEDAAGVSAQGYQSLQSYLPGSVPGYDQASPPGGSEQEVEGAVLRSAEQQWLSADGAARMKIVVTDCGEKSAGYKVATSFLFPSETEAEGATIIRDPSTRLDGVVVYRKDQGESQATLGVAERFVVDVKVRAGDDRRQETEQIAREVAEKLPR